MAMKLVMIILGGVMLLGAYQEYKLSSAAKEQPQAITAAQLIANGPKENANVVVSDFILCEMAYIYESKGSSWTKVYIPGSRWAASITV
jgi:hypothetical protein